MSHCQRLAGFCKVSLPGLQSPGQGCQGFLLVWEETQTSLVAEITRFGGSSGCWGHKEKVSLGCILRQSQDLLRSQTTIRIFLPCQLSRSLRPTTCVCYHQSRCQAWIQAAGCICRGKAAPSTREAHARLLEALHGEKPCKVPLFGTYASHEGWSLSFLSSGRNLKRGQSLECNVWWNHRPAYWKIL